MKLELSHSQKQVLSLRMQMSVNILQMNSLDLEQFIQESALENPLIELDMPTEVEDVDVGRLKRLEWLESMDENGSYRYVINRDAVEKDNLFEKETVDSLTDVLLAQLAGFRLREGEERRVRYLIGNLDENGYLSTPREQLALELACDEADLEQAIAILQRMDPAGVGACDLRECLLLQALRDAEPSPILIELIENHLDTLAKNMLTKLAKALGVSIDEVKEARDRLLTLNPKPGNGYTSYKAIPYIRPDLFIVRFESGYQIILNDYNQPKIEISSYYRELMKDTASEAAGYINERLGKAQWLVSCIKQRGDTILNCADSILKRQPRFFKYGPGNLVPMTLADVAGDIDLHPSTVCRAVRGKYLQCQWGVFGLADFFSRGVSSPDEGDSQSPDSALMLIKKIIEKENPQSPKSDQHISDELREYGVDISRRTVAKYRAQLGLPTAGGRKQF